MDISRYKSVKENTLKLMITEIGCYLQEKSSGILIDKSKTTMSSKNQNEAKNTKQNVLVKTIVPNR